MRALIVGGVALVAAAPASAERATPRCGPIAIAVLVEGHGLWLTPDRLRAVARAIDVIAQAGPPGSQGELIVYGGPPIVKVPMGDLARLTGAALGSPQDYQAIVSRDLADGAARALRDLEP